MGTEPRPPHLGVARGSQRCLALSSWDPTLLFCLRPPGSPSDHPRVLRSVPSASFQVPTLLSRQCPPLTHHGRCSCPGLRARCSADGSGGATGRCPRGHWLRPQPRGRRGHPTSPLPRRAPTVLPPLCGPVAPPHPLTPASCFPPALWASPGGVRTALPHLPGPRQGGVATRVLTPRAPPLLPFTLPPTLSATAACTLHTSRATRSPGGDKCPLVLAIHTLQLTGHTNLAGSGLQSHTQTLIIPTSTCMVGTFTLHKGTYLGIIHVHLSGNSCKVWDRDLRSRQNFHMCPSSGIMAQCWAGL